MKNKLQQQQNSNPRIINDEEGVQVTTNNNNHDTMFVMLSEANSCNPTAKFTPTINEPYPDDYESLDQDQLFTNNN
jgi:hypothetical protein